MSEIVVLDSRRDLRRQRTAPVVTADAVILLFTGVRYERESEPQPPADSATVRPSRRKRRPPQ
jgi:hypothetical protein